MAGKPNLGRVPIRVSRTGWYGLDPVEAYMLLSLAGHVGVNQLVNAPHVGARVTLPKSALPDRTSG